MESNKNIITTENLFENLIYFKLQFHTNYVEKTK